MIDSNYNVVYLPKGVADQYEVGQTFEVKGLSRFKPRHMKFDGLEIKNIDFQLWLVRLHFDWNDWKYSIPKTDKSPVGGLNF